MAFQQSVSGLNVFAAGLDIVGNNIANASTVGYKSSRGQFDDLFASYLQAGAVTGHGAEVQSVAQQFTQGGITRTDNYLDFAINGNGMFQVSSNTSGTEQIAYTRNGEFHYEPVPGTTDRYLVNSASGDYLMGWGAGVVPGGATSVLVIPQALSGLASTTGTLQVNLDDGATQTPATFDPTNPDSFTWSTEQTVYTGAPGAIQAQTLSYYFVKSATPNTWDVYTRLDGVAPAEEAGGPRQLVFGTSGLLQSGGTLTNTFVGGSITVDMTGSTQFASASDTRVSAQDGYADGGLASLDLDDNGTLQGRFSNGRTMALGTVALASFVNLNGLKSIGDNLWLETTNSGAANVGAAASGGRGVTDAYAREESNVDIANELINLITMQRNYQANAQMIKTQDDMLGKLAALR